MARSRSPLPIPPLECPLGDEHCALLDQVLQSRMSLCAYLDKLESIGLDMSAQRSECEGNGGLAEKLKAIHFPDRA